MKNTPKHRCETHPDLFPDECGCETTDTQKREQPAKGDILNASINNVINSTSRAFSAAEPGR
jgi:hypothetical protein